MRARILRLARIRSIFEEAKLDALPRIYLERGLRRLNFATGRASYPGAAP